MQFQNAAIALLAGMIFVLAGLVGWLYWQQTRTHQSLNTLAMVLAEMAQPPPSYEETPPVPDEPAKEDDRAEVVEDKPAPVAEVVSGPPPLDTDDLEGKTRKDLQDLLSKKGIPYGKTDSKTVLLQLLKASS
jgi:hypothetical protein